MTTAWQAIYDGTTIVAPARCPLANGAAVTSTLRYGHMSPCSAAWFAVCAGRRMISFGRVVAHTSQGASFFDTEFVEERCHAGRRGISRGGRCAMCLKLGGNADSGIVIPQIANVWLPIQSAKADAVETIRGGLPRADAVRLVSCELPCTNTMSNPRARIAAIRLTALDSPILLRHPL